MILKEILPTKTERAAVGILVTAVGLLIKGEYPAGLTMLGIGAIALFLRIALKKLPGEIQTAILEALDETEEPSESPEAKPHD